jgi:YD repeat-containing protein
VLTRRNVYDPASGGLIRAQEVDAAGTVVSEIKYAYDGLGRAASYTDADGNVSTATFDLMDWPLVTTDGKATRTYSYDHEEGVATSVAYTQQNCGTEDCTLFSESVSQSVHDQWRLRATSLS